MALIKCPECTRDVSDTAAHCPHCGYNLSRQKNIKSMQKSIGTFKHIAKTIKSNRKFKIVFSIIASVLALLVLAILYFTSPLLLFLLSLICMNVVAWFASYRWAARKKWFFWASLVLTGTMALMIVPLLFGLAPPDIITSSFCSLILVSIAFVIKLSFNKSKVESDSLVTPRFEKTTIDVHICSRCGEVYPKERPNSCFKCNNSVMRTVKVETINDGKLAVVTCLDCQQKTFHKTDKCPSCGSSNITTEYRCFKEIIKTK